jgi:hypothetical protein
VQQQEKQRPPVQAPPLVRRTPVGPLQRLSLKCCLATVVAGIAAALLFLVGQSAGPSASQELLNLRFLAVAIAIVANVAAFLTGVVAWMDHKEPCPWIVFNGLLIVVTVVVLFLFFLGPLGG